MNTLEILYASATANTESDLQRRVKQLFSLAKELSGEVEALRAEIRNDRTGKVELNQNGIDFYGEVERYEIELINSALNKTGGNQSRAAKLLQMKSTTLNAKMKHYGLLQPREQT